MIHDRAARRRAGAAAGLATLIESRLRAARLFFRDIAGSGILALFGFLGSLVLVAAVLVFIAEKAGGDSSFKSLFDGIWWAVVTVATVGYGDKYPVTVPGRLLAIATILASIVLTSLISGTVASIFVERRIREGKGLQDLKLKNHLIICGWNPNAEAILRDLEGIEGARGVSVVLVNWMEVEAFDAAKARFPALDLRFVRGDFTQEAVLRRASVKAASACVIVPDSSGDN
ncbi:MAG TPA: ion channel, partial [Rectinemataceae bacterium]|nr:ion channel [Rectinemataceae bacterium]